MLKSANNETGKTIFLIYPGEYYATTDDIYLSTIVGSCLAVCLFDSSRKIGGMVNFVVPGGTNTRFIDHSEISRIGVLNMEYLIGEMVKLGGNRKKMIAKIFGAAFLSDEPSATKELSHDNLNFVSRYFDSEKIILGSTDLGGEFRRKLYYSPLDGKVFRKKLLNNDEVSEFSILEEEYIQKEFRERDRSGSIFMFD